MVSNSSTHYILCETSRRGDKSIFQWRVPYLGGIDGDCGGDRRFDESSDTRGVDLYEVHGRWFILDPDEAQLKRDRRSSV